MKQEITYACGHKGVEDILGTKQERERRLWVLQNREVCPACQAAKNAERTRAAKEAAEADGMPALRGTEKQVAWAETIRANILDSMRAKKAEIERMTEASDKAQAIDVATRVLAYISTIPDARWWIDHRTDSTGKLYREIYNILPAEQTDAAVAETRAAVEDTDDKACAAIAESTVKPDNATHGLVQIEVDDTSVAARYARDDDFRKIVHDQKYSWDPDRQVWVRKITEFTGGAADRAAELANALLRNGFAVMCLDADVRRMAVDATYAPECTRWIRRRSDDTLLVAYERDDAITAIVRRMGGRWASDYRAYAVAMTRYDDLMELVRLYNFSVSRAAQRSIDAYHAQMDAATVVTAANPAHNPAASDPVRAILRSSRDVIPDLVDDADAGSGSGDNLVSAIYDYEMEHMDDLTQKMPTADVDNICAQMAAKSGVTASECESTLYDVASAISEEYHDIIMQDDWRSDDDSRERMEHCAWIAATLLGLTI